jgi:hypothetical protein
MEENLKKGRPSGDTFLTIIEDPAMEPFYITKDKLNFTVIERVKATRGFAGKVSSGKVSDKVVGYFTMFKFALKAVAREKAGRKHKSYPTILEYIKDWKEVENNINQMLNKVEL